MSKTGLFDKGGYYIRKTIQHLVSLNPKLSKINSGDEMSWTRKCKSKQWSENCAIRTKIALKFKVGKS